MTRTSFHCGWYVGLIVRVVLWSESAWERVDEEVKVEGCCTGVLSIFAIIREVSEVAERTSHVNSVYERDAN